MEQTENTAVAARGIPPETPLTKELVLRFVADLPAPPDAEAIHKAVRDCDSLTLDGDNHEIVCDDKTTYELLDDLIGRLTAANKLVISHFDPWRDLLHQAKTAVIARTKEWSEPVDDRARRCRRLRNEYDDRLRREREAEIRRIQAEQAAKAKAEQAARDKAALEEAERLEAEGKAAEAAALIEQREQEAQVEALTPPVEILPPAPDLPRGGRASVSSVRYGAEIVDLEKCLLAILRDPTLSALASADLAATCAKVLRPLAASQRERFQFAGAKLVKNRSGV